MWLEVEEETQGQFCKKFPVPHRNRCYLHNGNAATGAAVASYRHGRFSKYLPQGLLKKYIDNQNDPEFLTHKSELGLVDAHIKDHYETMKNGTGPDTFQKVRQAWKDLTRAKENHDEEAVDKAFKAMEDALTGEEEHSTNLSELLDLLELRRKTLEAETRRLTNSESTLNLEQNLTLIGFLQNAVKEPIYAHTPPDVAKRILKEISASFGRMVGVSNDGRFGPTATVIN